MITKRKFKILKIMILSKFITFAEIKYFADTTLK